MHDYDIPEQESINETVNLDGLDVSGVETIANQSCSNEFALYREYAIYKAKAIRCRLRGNIARAIEYEADCQRIYAKLPAEQQW